MSDVPDARTDRSGVASERRRQAILAAAIEVFADRGYEGASTREIAEAVGLKQGHLYYYFPAKQDLLFAALDGLHQEFLDGIPTWSSAAPPGEELRAVLIGHVRTVCLKHRQTRVLYENTRFLDPHRRDVIVAKRKRYEAAIGQLVTDRLGPGDRSPALVTKAVLGAANWVYQWYSEDGELDPAQLAERLADLAIEMVSPHHERQ